MPGVSLYIAEPEVMLRRKLEKYAFGAGFPPQSGDGLPAEKHDIILTNINLARGIPADMADRLLVVYDLPEAHAAFELANTDPRVTALLGKREDGGPSSWEVLYSLRRVLGEYHGFDGIPFLHWGARTEIHMVKNTDDISKSEEYVEDFMTRLGAPPKVRNGLAELTHELLMNAVYDAPVDEAGNHIYAQDRKQHVELPEGQHARLLLGTDGQTILLGVRDPFGGLRREHVYTGIARALSTGEMDTSGGGAGLGMFYVYRNSMHAIFTISPGNFTDVMVLYDLGINRRAFSSLARSVHFYEV